MRSTNDDDELTSVIGRLRSGHDTLPFMTRLYPATGMHLCVMPAEMQAVLEGAPDYRQPDPGEGPVWLQFASGNDAAELVVYRARTGDLYMAAPAL
ncbi:hypothetical protein ASF09_19130 [Sphingomonas sp. Leaf242]|nr:hypothetical protein ASF09_19130 [Sphingomonas sp. Leaf242]